MLAGAITKSVKNPSTVVNAWSLNPKYVSFLDAHLQSQK